MGLENQKLDENNSQKQNEKQLSSEQQKKFEKERQEIIMLSQSQRNSLSGEAVSLYLKNHQDIDISKYSTEIQKKIVEEVQMIFSEFKDFDTNMITRLRSIREGMSMGMESGKSDEYYRNMIIGNALQTRIKSIKLAINTITGERIKIGDKEYNKADYMEFENNTKNLDKKYGADIFSTIDISQKNIIFKKKFSTEIQKIIDPSNKNYNYIISDIERLPSIIGNKGFENLKKVKLNNGQIVNLELVYNSYNNSYNNFQIKNKVFEFGNRQILESKKGLGLNDKNYGVGYDEIKDIYKDKIEELNLENMGIADLVIMMRVLFSVIPVVGDSVGGYDDGKQALAGINFDGSMHGLGENAFMFLISGLQLSIVGGTFAKLAKGPKVAKAMSTLGKIIDKLSRTPDMLQDLARNEKMMKLLESMRGIPGIDNFMNINIPWDIYKISIDIPRSNGGKTNLKAGTYKVYSLGNDNYKIQWTERGKILEKEININDIVNANKLYFNREIDIVKLGVEMVSSAKKILLDKRTPLPKHRVYAGGREFILTDMIPGNNNTIIGYTKINGKYEVRYFYFSNSGGNWHCAPGVGKDSDGLYISKGEFWNYEGYTKSTVVNNTLQEALSSIPKVENQNGINIMEIWFEKIGRINTKEKQFDSFKNRKILTAGNGSFSRVKSIEELNNMSMAKDIDLNFTGGFYRGKNMQHKYLGEIKTTIGITKWNGKEIEIIFAQANDNPNLVWVENIMVKGSDIDSFGIQNNIVNGGLLTTKPFEYIEQVPDFIKNNYNSYLKKYGNYYDIRVFLQENPLIKAFKKYNSI